MNTGEMLFNRYRIIRTLGSGGMGTVYLVTDTEDGSTWAIKKTALNAINRNEAKILSGLRHEALPAFRESFESDGHLYMIMEYIQGETLSDIISLLGTCPEDRVRNWFLQITGILEYLHGREKPVVYRDLKPTNLIVDDNDRIRIIDFGIAEEYSEENRKKPEFAALTKGYAAPEQYGQEYAADVRTDIFALGATMHYALTGKNPQKPPYKFEPVRKLKADHCPAMERIVETCLQLNPEKRYQTARALRQDLVRIDDINRTLLRNKRKTGGLLIAAVVVIVIICCSVFYMTKTSREKQETAYNNLLEEASAGIENGSYAEVLQILEDAIERYPDLQEAYLLKAEVLFMKGEEDACKAFIRDVILPRFPEMIDHAGLIALMEAIANGSR